MKPIYMDNNATTPLHPEVKKTLIEAMDVFGNIGMGYTSVGSNTGERISIRYTGRLFEDPIGDMTISEQLIAQSTAINPRISQQIMFI